MQDKIKELQNYIEGLEEDNKELKEMVSDRDATIAGLEYDLECVRESYTQLESSYDDLSESALPIDRVVDQMKLEALAKKWERLSIEDIDKL